MMVWAGVEGIWFERYFFGVKIWGVLGDAGGWQLKFGGCVRGC